MKKLLIPVLLGVFVFGGFAPVAMATTTQADVFKNNLSLGNTGPEVVALQKRLEGDGFLKMPVGVSKGYFGAATKAALEAYQEKYALFNKYWNTEEKGIVGLYTRMSLNHTMPVTTDTPIAISMMTEKDTASMGSPENWVAGDPHTIYWKGGLTGKKTDVYLVSESGSETYKIGKDLQPRASDGLTQGYFIFKSEENPDVKKEQKYFIKVCQGLNCAVSERSFFYTEISPIKITSPKNGEIWKTGETKNIKWKTEDSFAVDYVRITIDGLEGWGGGYICPQWPYCFITSSVDPSGPILYKDNMPNTGTYKFKIPKTWPGEHTIRIIGFREEDGKIFRIGDVLGTVEIPRQPKS